MFQLAVLFSLEMAIYTKPSVELIVKFWNETVLEPLRTFQLVDSVIKGLCEEMFLNGRMVSKAGKVLFLSLKKVFRSIDLFSFC